MKPENNYYISTAIAYTSAKPHVGNVYEIVLSDAIARFKREEGYNVYFQTGTDEHGQKIEDNAHAQGVEPQVFVDGIASMIRGIFDQMNVSYDRFVRTTDAYHKEEVQKIFTKLLEKGDLYKGFYEGWYCKSDEAFYSDLQVDNGICPDCSAQLERQKEECYFFKLAPYQERLLKHIADYPEFIQPESRKNEMLKNFLAEPLPDLAVSRTSFKWGIQVETDPEHVIYVWIDALTNYITGIGYDVDGNHQESFSEFWPADVHVIGKDILRFHTIYWPILLMALDVELPKQIFGHPWLLTGDSKMSKSKGNAIYADDLANVFGVDALRYIMLHEMPYERDGHLTLELMIERINTDLANIMGNLVNRSVSMVNKYFNGQLSVNNVHEDIDTALIEEAKTLMARVEKKMETHHISDAISEIVSLFRSANKYIDETTPWTIAKDEDQQDRLQTVLYNLIEVVRIGGIALRSFIPETSDLILDQIRTQHRSFDSAKEFGLFELNHQVIEKTQIIFSRLDKEETLALLVKEEEVVEEEVVEEITLDEFQKVVMKTGTIVKVEKHKMADRLFVLQVDIGNKKVQIVSSLVGHFTQEELLNRKIVVVTNLKPHNFRGELSHGMLLATEDENGMFLVSGGEVANGTVLS